MIIWSNETGTWTPTLAGVTTGGTFTYTTRTGLFNRLGSLVYVSCRVTIATINSAPAGQMKISGLPFTTANSGSLTQPLTIAFGGVTLTAGDAIALALPTPNTTEILLYQTGSGAGITAITNSGMSSTTDLIISGCYIAEGVV